MTHCLPQFTKCLLDSQCMDILTCLGKCSPTDAECGFSCGMGTEAGKNAHFQTLLSCMVDNDCFEGYKESGRCLAEDNQALEVTDYSLVQGDWINNTTYCPGSDSVCQGDTFVTVPKVY